MLTLIFKKVGVPVLIADRADFKARAVIRVTEGHYIEIKGQFPKKS